MDRKRLINFFSFLFLPSLFGPQAFAQLAQEDTLMVERLLVPVQLAASAHMPERELAERLGSLEANDGFDPEGECAETSTESERESSEEVYLVSSEFLAPSVEFYFEVTAAVEEVQNTELESVDFEALLNELRPVVEAQDAATRNAAIASLCENRSSMDRIELGSALFGMLSNVYNYEMLSGSDLAGDYDQTRPQGEDQMITIQRQYNALNSAFYGQSQFPETGGVCRHASVLVLDFLNQCGFENQDLSGLAYATGNFGAHALVEVRDEASGNAYTLNWGRLTETSGGSLLSARDIPSSSIQSLGSIVRVYSYDESQEDAGLDGFRRNNRGVVVARLLGTDDENFDFTAYQTYEGGMDLLLAGRTNTYSDGSQTRSSHQLSLDLIHASRASRFLLGEGDTINGASAGYFYERSRASNGNASTIYAGVTAGGLLARETPYGLPSATRESQTLVGASRIGASRVYRVEPATIRAFGEIVAEGEVSALSTTSDLDQDSRHATGAMDGIVYARVGGSAEAPVGRAVVRISHSSNLFAEPALNYNSFRPQIGADRHNTSFSVAVPVGDGSASSTYRVLADVQRTSHEARVGYDQENLSASGGFRVYRESTGSTERYIVIAAGYRPTEAVRISGSVQTGLEQRSPLYQMSVTINR